MEKRAGQRPPQEKVVGCCRCGSTHPSRDKHGGDRIARRKRQRANRERSRDDCLLSSVMARALNPLQGGSVPRITERPVKLQLLQKLAVDRFGEGNSIRSIMDQAIYVGISNPTNRLAEMDENSGEEKVERDKKGQTPTKGEK